MRYDSPALHYLNFQPSCILFLNYSENLQGTNEMKSYPTQQYMVLAQWLAFRKSSLHGWWISPWLAGVAMKCALCCWASKVKMCLVSQWSLWKDLWYPLKVRLFKISVLGLQLFSHNIIFTVVYWRNSQKQILNIFYNMKIKCSQKYCYIFIKCGACAICTEGILKYFMIEFKIIYNLNQEN